MSDTDERRGAVAVLHEQPSSTVFCLLPWAAGFGRTRRFVNAGHPVPVPGPAGPLPYTRGAGWPAGFEVTAP
jgi:hypothetical protein